MLCFRDSYIDEKTKKAELTTLLLRGNHKSANEESARVEALLAKDVIHGFLIPLPVKLIGSRLHGAAVATARNCRPVDSPE